MSLPPNDTLPIGSSESNVQSSSEQIAQSALLTGPGRAAIAVIAIEGHSAGDCLQQLFCPAGASPIEVGQVRYGQWRGLQTPGQAAQEQPAHLPATTNQSPLGQADGDHQPASESVVVVQTSPQRYEIHCHGGRAAIERIFDDLAGLGVIRVAAKATNAVGVDTADQDDRLITEALEVLPKCTTTRTAAIALDQIRGALCDWRTQAIKTLESDANSTDQIAREAIKIVARGRVGVRLTRPWDVVLAGPPNVGKSSLINAIVGYDRSITMDVAGTTRDVLDAETVFDGWPVRLRDTAGLHDSDHAIEKEGIERALRAVSQADLVVQVSQPGAESDIPTLRRTISGLSETPSDTSMSPPRDSVEAAAVPILCVMNKFDLAIDRYDPQRITRQINDSESKLITTVATTGQGISELIHAIIETLLASVPPRGSAVPINQRQLEWVQAIADQVGNADAMLTVLRQA
ncbi:MAG: 50S ribosome-binding GTPase [Planctomycetales bacterium]|nr:50S ribosome-binding GTPase [Planctomycetales bacterium]